MRKAGLLLIFIVCLAAVCGCAADNKNPGDSLPADKYVAVVENLQTVCTIIEGNYTQLPHMTPWLSFVYDGSANGSSPGGNWASFTPFDGYYPAVNDSFKLLYGTVYYRDVSPANSMTGIRIRGVYSFPYMLQSGFQLQSIDRNGTIYGSYNNASIVLRSGEQWVTPITSEIKSGHGTGFRGDPYSYTASFNTTWKITNLGMIDKSNLTRYNNSASAIGFSAGFEGANPAEK